MSHPAFMWVIPLRARIKRRELFEPARVVLMQSGLAVIDEYAGRNVVLAGSAGSAPGVNAG